MAARSNRLSSLLRSNQREVIVLKVWSEFTFEQIATLLAASPNTVAGRYRYGMQKLRTCLKGIDYERLEFPGRDFAGMETASALT